MIEKEHRMQREPFHSTPASAKAAMDAQRFFLELAAALPQMFIHTRPY